MTTNRVTETLLAEIEAGEALTMAQVAKLFPGHRGGTVVNPSTPFRWTTKGTRTPDGRVVFLEAIRVGTRWLSSRSAVARYIEALTIAPTSAPPPRTPSASQAASQRASEALRRRGA